MNIFEYDGEEFDRKLEELFQNIEKEQLKKELVECGLEIKTQVYCVENEEFFKGLNDFENIVETSKIEIKESLIEKNKKLVNEGEEEKEWKEELALAA